MSSSHGCGQLIGHLGGQGIFSQVTLGLEVPGEVLSWREYVLEMMTRGQAAEVNGQKYHCAKPKS